MRTWETYRLLLNICIVFYAFGVHFSFGLRFMPWNMIGMDHFATLVWWCLLVEEEDCILPLEHLFIIDEMSKLLTQFWDKWTPIGNVFYSRFQMILFILHFLEMKLANWRHNSEKNKFHLILDKGWVTSRLIPQDQSF